VATIEKQPLRGGQKIKTKKSKNTDIKRNKVTRIRTRGKNQRDTSDSNRKRDEAVNELEKHRKQGPAEPLANVERCWAGMGLGKGKNDMKKFIKSPARNRA